MPADPRPHDPPAPALALAALRARWRAAPSPTIEQILTPDLFADDDLLAEAVAADAFERRLRNLPARPEDYLTAAPSIVNRPSACRALLMSELVARSAEGLDAVEADLLARLPALAESTRAVTALARAFQDAVDGAPPPKSPGLTLGKYTLHARLGHGAFGETWQAWDTVLERFVALKILHSAHLSGERGARAFLQEARAAAALDHDSIVRIHEAGRFQLSGEYYLDSQLVGPPLERGQEPDPATHPRTLDDLLRAGPIPPLRAARLIATCARALAAAHARGVTHRDIKPSNILLASDDRPMVADFGLSITATSLTPAPSTATPPNQATTPSKSTRITGTPAYIAPELANGQKPTPLSDVYSLGATLRALLTGAHPVEPDQSSDVDPITQVVERVRSLPLAPLSRASPTLPPTLCAICDRATRFDAADRYPSADRFAEDLEAFLEHRPTLAAAPGAVGVGLLWLRRNRLPAIAALAVLALIAGLTIGFVNRLSIERDRAVAAQAEADRQRDAALVVQDTMLTTNQFLARAFNSTRGQENSATFTAMKVLELAGERVGRTFADRPLVEASVRHFLGQAAIGAGGFDLARSQLDRALEIRREKLGQNHPDTLATVRQLGDLAEVRGDRDQARVLYKAVFDGLNQPEGAENPDCLRAIAFLGARAAQAGDRATAFELLGRADRGFTRLNYKVGADHQAVLNSLVLLYIAEQKFDQALQTQSRIVDMNRANLGPDDISTLNAQQALGWVYRSANRSDEAASVYRACLERYHATVGPRHPMSLHVGIELAIAELGKNPTDALDTVTPVVDIARSLTPGNQLLLRALIARGRAELTLQRTETALATFREAFEACLRDRGPAHATTHEAATLLANLLDRQGQPEQARAIREQLKPVPPATR